MQLTGSLKHRARAGLAAAVAVTALGVTPILAPVASAAPAGVTVATSAAECAAAKAALSEVRRKQRVARTELAAARKALRKAKAQHRPAKVRKATKAVQRAGARYRTVTRKVDYRHGRAAYACAAPQSAVRAKAAGKALGLLAVANGVAVGPISAADLTALLDRLLPGLADQLTAGQLSSLLSGFNGFAGAGSSMPDLLASLAGSFTTDDVTALLGGVADPAVVEELAGHLLGLLGGLGGLPVPGSFDPTDLLETLAGVFGELDPTQLGQLLALVSTAVGGGSGFDLTQLTGLLDSLVPGITGSFDPTDLTAMLTAFNGGGLSADALANLLGGRFSATQLQSVLSGTAGPDLVGAVIAQVMAQLATAGGGDLALPTGLDLGMLTDLVSTVTSLLNALTGGGVLPVIFGVLPFLCS